MRLVGIGTYNDMAFGSQSVSVSILILLTLLFEGEINSVVKVGAMRVLPVQNGVFLIMHLRCSY